MTSQTLTYRSLLRELRRLLAAGLQPDPQTVADLRSLMQQFRLDFLNALDFPVSDRLVPSHNGLGENHASLRASEPLSLAAPRLGTTTASARRFSEPP